MAAFLFNLGCRRRRVANLTAGNEPRYSHCLGHWADPRAGLDISRENFRITNVASGKWKCAEMNPVRCPNRILRTRWRWRSGPESRGARRCPISSSVDRYATGAQPRTHLYLRPSQEYHLCNEGQHPADVCCGIQGARRCGSL